MPLYKSYADYKSLTVNKGKFMKKYIILGALFGLLCLVCYIRNIVLLSEQDFEPPYKIEVLRGVGVAIPPIGLVLGCITFEEEREEDE